MKISFRILLVVISVFLFHTSYSQKLECGWYGKKTVQERNKIFPFDKAKKVVLIAYYNHELRIDKNVHVVNMNNLTLEEAKKDDPQIINKYSAGNYFFQLKKKNFHKAR